MSGPTILKTIWRMKWVVIATILVFLGISAFVTLSLPVSYQGTATISVSPPEPPKTDTNVSAASFNPNAEVQASQALARTYTELLKSRGGFEAAVAQGNIPVSANQLRGATKVAYVNGTNLIQVQVTDQDRRQASDLANALAEAFIVTRDNDDARLFLADPATPAGGQVQGPNLGLNLILALLLGTAVAVAGALLLSRFRGYVSSPEEVEELVEAPILGSLPHIRKKAKNPSKSAAFEEAINAIRVNLDFALDNVSNGSGRTIVITSALPGEGKTVVSCALASSYARAGHECLIIDAALREPRVHDCFSVPNARGLSEVLVEEPELPRERVTTRNELVSTRNELVTTRNELVSTLEGSVSTLDGTPNLAILTGGNIPPNPVDLLSSDRTRELIHSLRERFDTVILDSPPAFPLVDASILGRQADGIVLVADRKARRRDLLRAADQLRSGKGRIVGVVLEKN